MVLSYIPGWDHGEVDNIGIGNYDGGFRTLIEWQPIDPSLANSEEHRFLLALYARKTVSAEPPGPILAFTILENWPERTPWTNQPAIELEPAGSFKFEGGEGWKVFDITPIVRSQAKLRCEASRRHASLPARGPIGPGTQEDRSTTLSAARGPVNSRRSGPWC